MSAADFIPKGYSQDIESGSVSCSAPSNIAIVKYWGKKSGQLPANPSLSFTLKNCRTITSIDFSKKPSGSDFTFDLKFDGNAKESFRPKISQYLARISEFMPFLKNYDLHISTTNTFPHSSGIASSASGMAAMSMNLMQIEKKLDPTIDDDHFYKKASFLARLGSGSACRSIKGGTVVWGKHKDFPESSDLFGTEFTNVHSNFTDFQDTILLVDKGQKTISSSVGHELMHGHPFAAQRFEQAHTNLSELKTILETGDLEKFVSITESEALTLHAMMMTSIPYFILMKPNTLEIINKIWEFRKNTNFPVCFTLDAGANVHVLYPYSCKTPVLEFIKAELLGWCENGQYICDEKGSGGQLIIDN